MIRICHVQVLSILSGVQRAMLQIFDQLDRSRYEIHVACHNAGPLTDLLEERGIFWHEVPALDRPIHPTRDWLAYRQLKDLFSKHRFDLVHTHSSKPGLLGRAAAHKVGVPSIFHTVHGFAFHEFSPAIKRWFYSRLERWAGTRCDRVLFVNHEERELAINQGWLPASKCTTVYNGADLQALDPARSETTRRQSRTAWGWTDNEVVILFAGRLEPPKNPLILPEIACALQKLNTTRPWRIVVAGAGQMQAELEKRIAAWGVKNCISLLGWQENSHPALAAADALLLPSLFEGLSLIATEAQAAGLPIVASNVKGNREVVTPDTGYLCDRLDPVAYAEKLALLINNPRLRSCFGSTARLRAEQHFDTVANHRRIAALYDDLLSVAQPANLLHAA